MDRFIDIFTEGYIGQVRWITWQHIPINNYTFTVHCTNEKMSW